MIPPKKDQHRPEAVGDVLQQFLKDKGLDDRVEQAAVIPEWASLVGQTVAAQTSPLYVTADGTLFVAVRTHAWMSELQLMAPEILRSLNAQSGRAPIRRLRFRLLRESP